MTHSSDSSSARPSRLRLLRPMLAGATWRERLVSCFGALVAIGLTGLLCGLMLGNDPQLPLLVAPMGASAVLLFAVPASPLAQPWSIIGGNTLSAFIGYGMSHIIPHPMLAAGAAVGFAIAAMSIARCLHPPGGAAALTVALGGPVVAKWGALFPLVPVALNSCILVCLGILFHRLAKRSYPHAAPPPANPHGTSDPPATLRAGPRQEDLDAALDSLGETFDIDPQDLQRLLREIEQQALLRTHANLLCEDIMSRDVISVPPTATPREAQALLLRHDVRTLPVMDADGHLLGTVGLRDLVHPAATVAEVLAPARTAEPRQPAAALLPALADGRTHAVMIVDAEGRVTGVVSQTDLLGSLGKVHLAAQPA
ncbi:HPP family protein [Bordetella genomosp. 13]|uniref:HPP family protein n=1 Tax=Bordetella genomosp. 13 TaxID=463040 RepID=UPI0011A0077E|nr:HPP family protein [Bordetella genomosp. 13]